MPSLIATVPWLILILSCCYTSNARLTNENLVIVSLDGLKESSYGQKSTPNLYNIGKNGVVAKKMKNSFPTKTMPNHRCIDTGLYTKNHSVSGNGAYDRFKQKFIGYSYNLYHVNRNITPIYRKNQDQGGKSGVMMWPGSEFENCRFVQKLDKKMSHKERVNTAISWLHQGANLVMIYLEQPDAEEHAWSPDSQKARNKIRQMDEIILHLEQSINKNKNLRRKTNIIILSDHGMRSVKRKDFIDLNQFMDQKKCKTYGSSPVLTVVCSQGKSNQACRNLTMAGNRIGTFNAYTNNQLPKHWHFENDQRTGPCTVVAKPKYAFAQDMLNAGYVKRRGKNLSPNSQFGVHGYDPDDLSMRPIFVAKGVRFRNGVTVMNEFTNIDLIHLFCKLLGLDCGKVDGKNRNDIWNQMLKPHVST